MKKLLEELLKYYLIERSVEKTLSLFTEDIISIGTGEHEVGYGKEELKQLLISEFKEFPNSFDYEYCDYKESRIQTNVRAVFINLCIKYVENCDLIVMDTRLTCTVVNTEHGWKIASLHMSTPSMKQEEQSFFPLHYGKNVVGQMSSDSDAQLLELISKALPGGIMGQYMEEEYPLYVVNDKMLKILGYTYKELIEATDEKMMNIVHPEDRQRVYEGIKNQMLENNEYEIEYRAIAKANRILWVNEIGKKIFTRDGREAIISIITDITQRIERENRLANEAERDSLTQLYNRRKFIEVIEEEFKNHDKGILFICDVDNFKTINDTKGHAAGDTVLRKLAHIMDEQAGALSYMARLGGDEYALFFPERVSQESAVEAIRRIQQEFLNYMQVFAPELNISLSVGGTERKYDEDIRTLYRKADGILYQAKQDKGTLKIL